MNIYVSSCAEDGGIYRYNLNKNGKLEFLDITPLDRPMYTIKSDKKMHILLRAPFENSNDSGIVTAEIAEDGVLTKPTSPISTKGEVACHLTEYNGEIFCANYISGSVFRTPDLLKVHEGYGPNLPRQDKAHTHFTGVTPDKKYIAVCDLGLDTVFFYDKNLNVVNSVKVPDGHGARHLVFSDDGKYMFVVNELKSTVSVFSHNDAKCTLLDTKSCLPADFTGESFASAIRLKNGKIYVSNRGHNSIAELNFDGRKLELISAYSCHGNFPRDFDFFGEYIVCTNQFSNDITVLDKDFNLTDKVSDIKEAICVTGE